MECEWSENCWHRHEPATWLCVCVMRADGREFFLTRKMSGRLVVNGEWELRLHNKTMPRVALQQIQFSRVLMRTSVWNESESKRDCEDGKGKVSFSSDRSVLGSLNGRGWKGIRIAIEQVLGEWWEFPFMKLVDNTMSRRRGRPSTNSPFTHSHSVNWVLLRDYKTTKLFILSAQFEFFWCPRPTRT